MDREHLQKMVNFDTERGCFACGPENPIGLKMEFFTDGKTVYSWPMVSTQLCGWKSVVHGGIVTTMLDEVMSWAAYQIIRKLILTRSIHVDFMHPVPAERPLRAEGAVKEITRDTEGVLTARLFDDVDRLCAKATGVFALMKPKIARRLGIIEDSIIDNFERWLQASP